MVTTYSFKVMLKITYLRHLEQAMITLFFLCVCNACLVGCGPIGLFGIGIAKAMGATKM